MSFAIPNALKATVNAPKQTNFQADDGGYYTLRSDNDMVFIRCASFRDRPSQADMLHVDLWHNGINIATDAGTYSYNAKAPWNNPLASTRYHNTVTVDGLDQMERAGKFLWLPWLNGEMQTWQSSANGQLAYWQGGHDGYGRLPSPVTHQRGIIRIDNDSWLILDRLQSQAEHAYRLHWLLADFPHHWDENTTTISLETPSGSYYTQFGIINTPFDSTVIRADEDSPDGWHAPYYNTRKPALSLSFEAEATNILFWSVFSTQQLSIVATKEMMTLKNREMGMAVQLETAVSPFIIKNINIIGNNSDSLTITT